MGVVPINRRGITYSLRLFRCRSIDGNSVGWAYCRNLCSNLDLDHPERVVMVGSTAMLVGMILVGLAVVVVESAVTSIYICYAEDPTLINRPDAVFFTQISETLHQRLQHRSLRPRELLRRRADEETPEAVLS
ncbi:UNVERIFIED_CONTAM: hypothetical protein Sradi_0636200 [Sesamum radiatum]|uniref:Uncharacterized protein n=1 Tax=Sesamum radiatum TaxID=300843 RepID=A0AAW2VLM2_SESRA